MPGVPNQAVVLKVEYVVQCQAEFDDAQIRREMGSASAQQIAQHATNFTS